MKWLGKLLYPALVQFECPQCGAAIDNFDIKFGAPFPCGECNRLLCVSQKYARSVDRACLVLGALLSLPVLFRLSWSTLWLWPLSAFAFSIVVAAVASLYVKIVFPPKIQVYVPDESPLTLFRKPR